MRLRPILRSQQARQVVAAVEVHRHGGSFGGRGNDYGGSFVVALAAATTAVCSRVPLVMYCA